jgi:hypothetical protein
LAFPQIFEEKNNTPDTIYHNISGEKQLIEIDRESAWQRDVDWHEGTQPRALSWSSLIPLPERNVILIRNRQNVIIQVFNDAKPISYWNSIFQKNKTVASDSKIKMISDPHSEYRFLKKSHYPYLGNQLVRTHLKNGCYLVNHIIPDASNSINRLDGKHLGVIDSTGMFVLPIIYEYIELIGDVYLVKKEGLVGIVNKQSEIILPLIYEAAAVKQDGSVVFSKNGKVKKIYHGEKKKLSTINDYDWIDENRLDDKINPSKSDLIMVVKNGKYGLVNRNFKVMVAPIYDYLSYAQADGLIRVCDGQKWGFLNKNGSTVIPIEYDDAIDFYEGRSLVKKGDSSFCIDMNGRLTSGCVERYAKWEFTEGGSYTQYIKGRRIVSRAPFKGVTDDEGKLIVPIMYAHIIGMESNTSEYRWSKLYYKASIGNRWGVLDKNGKVMIPFVYDEVYGFMGGMELYMVRKNNQYGLFDNQFNEVLSCVHGGIDFVTFKGKYWFRKKEKWGLMDKDQKMIIDPQYDSYGWMKNGKIQVTKNKKNGMIDTLGRIIIPLMYDAMDDETHHGLIVAELKNKWGYLDSLGKITIPFEYDDIRKFYKSIAGVKKEGNYFFINASNERINSNTYDFIDHDWFGKEGIKVMRNKKVGIVDVKGNEVIPCEYDDINGYSVNKGFSLIKGHRQIWMKINPSN